MNEQRDVLYTPVVHHERTAPMNSHPDDVHHKLQVLYESKATKKKRWEAMRRAPPSSEEEKKEIAQARMKLEARDAYLQSLTKKVPVLKAQDIDLQPKKVSAVPGPPVDDVRRQQRIRARLWKMKDGGWCIAKYVEALTC